MWIKRYAAVSPVRWGLRRWKLPALLCRYIAGLSLLSLAAAPDAAATDFIFHSDKGQSLVRVTTSNQLMIMEHSTSEIEGKMSVNLEDVRGSASVQFTVYTANMSSRQDLWKIRDKLMRSDYLETARYPSASFTLTSIDKITANALKSFEPATLEAEGDFTLHGVTKPIKLNAVVTYMQESPATQARHAGDLMHIMAEWTFKLSDHQIKIPRIGPMLFNDEQKMLLRVVGSTVR
jgi:polyisoprenoid-binding protein YceI